MADELTLRFEELRAALLAVLTNAEGSLGAEVPVDRDYYWALPVEAAFDMSSKPMPPTVGQLSDDLQTVVQDSWRPELARHDLGHLVGILRALEERLAR